MSARLELEAQVLRRLISEVTDAVLQDRDNSGVAKTPQSVQPFETAGISATSLAAMIDHTLLRPEATRADIELHCAEAKEHRFASVCVQPTWVSLVARELRRTPVVVGTVAGFPTGAIPTKIKCLEAEMAIAKGAREIDVVMPFGLLRSGELDVVKQEIETLARLCHRHETKLKVILEAAALDEEQIATGCALACLAGADFVKTSTGFHPSGGARTAHVALMRQVVGSDMGVKAAGGIRSAADAMAMIRAGANRIGSSASVMMIQELAR